MIETQYEPGTVAIVTNAGKEYLAMRTTWPAPEWTSVTEGTLHAVESVRPLVVLDPEDEATIDRIAGAIRDYHGRSRTGVWTGIDWLCTREAVRSLTRPPKPEEPTGLGAVVEDASHVEYIHLGSGLWAYGTTDGPSQGWRYADIDAVKVLSEGVQP